MKKHLTLLSILLLLGCTNTTETTIKGDFPAQPVPSLKDKAFIPQNNIKILQLHYNTDTLQLISDDRLTWDTFAKDNSFANIEQKFRNLKKRDTEVYNKRRNKRVKGVALASDKSFLFFVNHSLSSAYIGDTDIELTYGIKVGMPKADFFKIIFNEKDELYNMYYPANVIINSDPPGVDFDTYFVFKADTLRYIKVVPY